MVTNYLLAKDVFLSQLHLLYTERLIRFKYVYFHFCEELYIWKKLLHVRFVTYFYRI